jgi:mannose-6-phosphate isomerase-like protein (cupin superfamily)
MATERFITMSRPAEFTVTAPDGSGICELPRLSRGSMAHGTLAPGSTSRAIRHRTVDEIWYVLGGSAEIWRRLDGCESIETIRAGDALTIPVGTHFQFRTVGDAPFTFVMCTMPPWSGADEAIRVDGVWTASIESPNAD